MGRKSEVKVREFFKFTKEKVESECKICKRCFKGNYLSNLKRHLITEHKDIYDAEIINEDEEEVPEKKIKFSVNFSKTEVQEACVDMVTTERLPFSFLDSDSFKTLTQQIFTGLNIPPITSRNIMTFVTERYEIKKREIIKKLAGEVVCLKIDTATRLNRGILGVNVQMCKNVKIYIATLGLIELHKRQTSENIKSEIENIIMSFGIKKTQIYSVTTDNGRNMLKAVELLSDSDEYECEIDNIDGEMDGGEFVRNINIHAISSIKCAAHTLQLAVKDFLVHEQSSEVISRAREMAKSLRTPKYRNAINAEGFCQPELDTPTRWNSTYKMLDKILSLQEFCDKQTDEFLNLAPSEWEKITALVNVLRPVYLATLKLQTEQLFLGDFCKVWLELKLQVESLRNASSAILLRCLQQREIKIMSNEATLAAIYLDPRIRRILVNEPLHMLCAKSHLKQLAQQLYNWRNTPPSTATRSDSQPSTSSHATPSLTTQVELTNQSTCSLLGQYLDSIEVSQADEELDCNDTNDLVQKAFFEIENYKPKAININIHIMEYWQKQKFAFPHLYQLAKIVHSVPATQASVERSFSALKLILSDLRYNLSAKALQKLMFLKVNKN